MRRTVIGIVALAVIAVVPFLAILIAGPSPKYVLTDTVTRENLSVSISAAAGETFVIRLGTNPSTGYDWNVTTSGQVSFVHWTAVGGGGAIGAPVTRDYEFVASTPGSATITLLYERAPPAFSSTDVAKTLVISVEVTR